jgi:hypothetical protein
MNRVAKSLVVATFPSAASLRVAVALPRHRLCAGMNFFASSAASSRTGMAASD